MPLQADNSLAAQDSWADQAACSGSTMDFTSDDPGVIAAAKAFCRTQCPVRDECLQHALDHREEWGVWGGLDPHERLQIRPDMFTPAGTRPAQCLFCNKPFRPLRHNARLCSESCRAARKRTREMAYVRNPGAETRLCPVCHRSVRRHRHSIPNHLDATGESMCPGTGQPYSITLPNPTTGAVS